MIGILDMCAILYGYGDDVSCGMAVRMWFIMMNEYGDDVVCCDS